MSKPFKFKELDYITELVAHIESTYGDANHYVGSDSEDGIQTVEYWDSLDIAIPTCIATAIKYLSRFGKKKGYNKQDLYKAMHNIIFLLHFAEKRGLLKKPETPIKYNIISGPLQPYAPSIFPPTGFDPLNPFGPTIGIVAGSTIPRNAGGSGFTEG